VSILFYVSFYVQNVHDHRLYIVCPDVLSMVGETP